jgi:hypothetical protein
VVVVAARVAAVIPVVVVIVVVVPVVVVPVVVVPVGVDAVWASIAMRLPAQSQGQPDERGAGRVTADVESEADPIEQ